LSKKGDFPQDVPKIIKTKTSQITSEFVEQEKMLGYGGVSGVCLVIISACLVWAVENGPSVNFPNLCRTTFPQGEHNRPKIKEGWVVHKPLLEHVKQLNFWCGSMELGIIRLVA